MHGATIKITLSAVLKERRRPLILDASFETSGRGRLVLIVACRDGARLQADAAIVPHV